MELATCTHWTISAMERYIYVVFIMKKINKTLTNYLLARKVGEGDSKICARDESSKTIWGFLEEMKEDKRLG